MPMNIELFSFEKKDINISKQASPVMNEEEINQKYELGEARIVTEQGAIRLPLLKRSFEQTNYTLKPQYQRRVTWSDAKRSRLIESFIINIPIPPVFIYEYEFGSYEVMDGLQRISAIIDFYSNKYSLSGLEEWPELNGMTYNQLPQKIREGIDRRQLSVVTLLKESSKNQSQAQTMKKTVFERLNSGGEKLLDQEVRNALYGGPFNDKCIELSGNETFRILWSIKPASDVNEEEVKVDDDSNYDEQLRNDLLYKRMFDVELVLRFFSMRHLTDFTGNLNKFLDENLRIGNEYSTEQLSQLGDLFLETIGKAYSLFGEKAFCKYTSIRGNMAWTIPQRVIYDPLMIALSQIDKSILSTNIESNIVCLQKFYNDPNNIFDGRKQTKNAIEERALKFYDLIRSNLSR